MLVPVQLPVVCPNCRAVVTRDLEAIVYFLDRGNVPKVVLFTHQCPPGRPWANVLATVALYDTEG